MADFETHSRGTAEEIRLSRQLAREIQWVIDSGGVMPVQIRTQYEKLNKHYQLQMENET
jgi:hypothetical protein